MAIDPGTAVSAAQVVGQAAGLFNLFGGKPDRKVSHISVGVNKSRTGFVATSRGGPGGDAGLPSGQALARELSAYFKDAKRVPWAGNINFIYTSNARKVGESPYLLTVLPQNLRQGTSLAGLNPKNRVALGSQSDLIGGVLDLVKAKFPQAPKPKPKPKPTPRTRAKQAAAKQIAAPTSSTAAPRAHLVGAPAPSVAPVTFGGVDLGDEGAPSTSQWAPLVLAAAAAYLGG